MGINIHGYWPDYIFKKRKKHVCGLDFLLLPTPQSQYKCLAQPMTLNYSKVPSPFRWPVLIFFLHLKAHSPFPTPRL